MELLTPAGLAGVAVVRVAPSERAAVLAALRTTSGAPFGVRANVPQRALLRLAGRDLDDVLVVARASGALELHVHGAPAVLDELRERFGLATSAAPSPAAALLRSALSPEQLDLALEQLAFDFAAEHARIAALPRGERGVARDAAIERSRVALALAAPVRVVLAGRQNAGKSSLFNALLCRERVLAGPTPGLTRDPIAEPTALAGYPYELVDTAGEGDSPAAVDAAAVVRGRALREGALVVLAVDGSVGPHALDRAFAATAALVVATKADLPAAPWPADVPRHVAASVRAASAAALRAQLGELLRAHRALPVAGPVGGFAALTVAQREALTAVSD